VDGEVIALAPAAEDLKVLLFATGGALGAHWARVRFVSQRVDRDVNASGD
jgi:hypothetical protein